MSEQKSERSAVGHGLTPHIVVRDAAVAIDFYERAFGALELARQSEPGGTRLLHAVMRFGDSILMLVDTFPEFGGRNPDDLGGSPVTLHLSSDDVDALVARAQAAGATVTMPPDDMPWGDRYARLTDPFGHSWSVATRVREMTPNEVREALAKDWKAGG